MNLLSVIAASRRRGGAFDPLSLTPALWLDASDADTLFDATSGGSAVAADGVVKRWEDKSVSGYNVSHVNGPTYKTSIYNSLPTLRFNGINQILAGDVTDLLRNCSGGTLVVVRKASDSIAPFEQLLTIRTNSGALTLAQLEVNDTGGRSSFAGRRLQADSQQRITGSSSTAETLGSQIAVVDYSTANASLYFNGSLEASSSSFQTAGTTADLTSKNFSVGARPDGAQAFSGDICEIYVFNRAISDADRNALHNYLVAKWGIT